MGGQIFPFTGTGPSFHLARIRYLKFHSGELRPPRPPPKSRLPAGSLLGPRAPGPRGPLGPWVLAGSLQGPRALGAMKDQGAWGPGPRRPPAGSRCFGAQGRSTGEPWGCVPPISQTCNKVLQSRWRTERFPPRKSFLQPAPVTRFSPDSDEICS